MNLSVSPVDGQPRSASWRPTAARPPPLRDCSPATSAPRFALEIGPNVYHAGASHVLNPVIAPELKEFRWQHAAGRNLNKDVGTILITANSLAIDREIKDKKGHVIGHAPTLLVVTGGDAADAHLVNNPTALSQAPADDAVTPRKYTIATAPMP